MAYTRIFQGGAETGRGLEGWDAIIGTGLQEPISSTDQAKTGSRSYKVNSSSTLVSYFQKTILATRQVRGHFFEYGNAPSGAITCFSIVTSAGGSLLAVEADTGGNLDFFVAGVEQGTYLSYQGAAWKSFGFDINIDSSAGWFKVWIDGVLVFSFEGNTGNADIGMWRLGRMGGSSATFTHYYDNVYLDDSTGEIAMPPAITYFAYRALDGNGNYNDWDGSDGNSVDNYLLLDEVPPGADTDYIETNVADELESFTVASITLAAGQEIVAVLPVAFARRNGTTELIAVGTRLSATDLISSDKTPATAYKHLFERQTTKPGGGAWSESDFNSAEVIVKSRGTY